MQVANQGDHLLCSS